MMKNRFKAFAVVAAVATLTGCDSMISIHEQYLNQGEKIYLGIPEIVRAQAGEGRIQLVWKLNADPKIDKCCIYWNNRKDSVEIPADRSDTAMFYTVKIPEGKYTFEIKNKSNEWAETSLTKSISASSYGAEYINSLYPRDIQSMVASPDSIIMHWADVEGCIGVNLSYENNRGVMKKLHISSDVKKTVLKDYVVGGTFSYNSLYVPEPDAIDTIASNESAGYFPIYYTYSKEEWEKIHAQNADVDKTNWTATANSEELTGEGAVNGRAAAILDGSLSTFWHSKWDNGKDPLPFNINIDMQKEQVLNSIELARRTDNTNTKTVIIKISNDNQNWTEIGSMVFPNSAAPNSKVLFYPKTVRGRYLMLNMPDSNSDVCSLSEVFFTTTR